MKKLHISMAGKRAVNGYLFILPWLLGFLLFYVRSLYMTVEFSLSDLTVLSTGGYNLEFVGLKNYYEAFFSHASFKQTLTTSIGNMVIDVPLIIFFSLFVAMMLNRKMKCRGLVRAIFFLPVLLGAEAVSNALSLAAQMMAGGLSGTSADMAAGWSRVQQQTAATDGKTAQITYEQIAAVCGDDASTWGARMQFESDGAWKVYAVTVGQSK